MYPSRVIIGNSKVQHLNVIIRLHLPRKTLYVVPKRIPFYILRKQKQVCHMISEKGRHRTNGLPVNDFSTNPLSQLSKSRNYRKGPLREKFLKGPQKI